MVLIPYLLASHQRRSDMKYQFIPALLGLSLLIFGFNCGQNLNEKEGPTTPISSQINTELSIDDNHQLQFTYEIQPSDNDPNRFSVNAEIKNTGSTPFYFLSESCNGLDYYIEAEPSAAQVEIIMHCNVTYPKRIEILPLQSFAFKSRLRTIGTCENARLKLMLIVLEKDELLDGKSISDFRLKSSHKTVQLIGPRIAL